jgi:hypothetical protein
MGRKDPGSTTRKPVSLEMVARSPLEQVGELENGWTIRVSLTETRARTFVSSVTLTCPVDAPQTVTAAAWRAVPVGAVVDEAMRIYVEVIESADDVLEDMDREWLEAWSQPPGPQGHSDEMYARLVQNYALYVTEGSRSPVEDLAKSMKASRATTSQRLQVARQRGLLDGLELTAHARSLIGIPGYQ